MRKIGLLPSGSLNAALRVKYILQFIESFNYICQTGSLFDYLSENSCKFFSFDLFISFQYPQLIEYRFNKSTRKQIKIVFNALSI